MIKNSVPMAQVSSQGLDTVGTPHGKKKTNVIIARTSGNGRRAVLLHRVATDRH